MYPRKALTTRRYPEYLKERVPAVEALADDFYTDVRDEDLYDEAYTTQAMSTYDVTRMSQFPQVTTNIPPWFGGKTSWFAHEDAIDDWCDITELDDEKGGPALRNRRDAAIFLKILDRDALKNKEEGVLYFKRTLRPFFVKGSVNVFCPVFSSL